MEFALILAGQVAVMFLVIGTGVLCKKINILGEDEAKAVCNMLLLIVIPVMIIRAMQADLVPALLPGMGLTAVAALLVYIYYIFMATKLSRDPGDGSTAWKVDRLGMVLSNAGFMGFPLISATVGEDGLLYGAVFLGIFNTVSWVWGKPTLTGVWNKPRELAGNPTILAFVFSVVCFLLQIRFPPLVLTFLDYLYGLNTPLSLIVVGVFLASVKPGEALRDKRIYFVALVRNLVLPICTLLLFWAVRVSVWLPGGKTFALAFLILVSCPSAANTILLSARYGCDSSHGAKVVAVSTFFSVVTLPLIILAADLLL